MNAREAGAKFNGVKIPIAFPDDAYLDDAPVFNWNEINDPPPMRSWRAPEPCCMSAKEVATLGILGLIACLAVYGVLVMLFVCF